ncbi:hypothetical protein HG530_013463 [Fusarium avenaceum]|nr:hypothetical protein HG530_013463 [Fusarium avenaceum]
MKDTGKDKRNYEGPLSDDDDNDDILIRKTREAFEQKTVVVDEKTMVNEPRYLRKEQMVRRPTHPVGYKKHEGENSKLIGRVLVRPLLLPYSMLNVLLGATQPLVGCLVLTAQALEVLVALGDLLSELCL